MHKCRKEIKSSASHFGVDNFVYKLKISIIEINFRFLNNFKIGRKADRKALNGQLILLIFILVIIQSNIVTQNSKLEK